METIARTTDQTLATLASLPIRASKEGESLKLLPAEPPRKPCETSWQKKWLKLNFHHPKIQAMADRAEAFCGRWYRFSPTPALLVLVGEPNCGKTHTARAIYQFARSTAFQAFVAGKGKTWGKRIPALEFMRWPEIVDDFKNGNYGTVNDMIDTDLLVLDDVGAEHDPSKSAASKLCQILSRRERKFTVLTSNVPPTQWPERFDTRIADRLIRNSEVIDLFGVPSYATL